MTGCVLRGAAALAALVCLALLPSCGRDPVFPENYASTYGQVSNCVYSIDHNLHHVKIYVSPEAVLPYCATENPLPDTTIIVKEEYDGDDDACTGPILGIKAARKEPGSAPSRCDWFWQDLKPNLHVLREGDIGSCTSCHSDAMYTPADCTALAVRNGPDCPLLCGNGRIDMGEACDDGAANSNTMPDACRTNCGLPYCSDGVTDVMRGETCDDGNTLDGDQCGHGCDAPPPVPATVDLGAAPSPAAWRLSAAGPVLAVGDFDGDGRRDVAFGDGAAATVRVVLGVDLPPAASPAAVDVALAAVVSVTGAPGSALGAALAAGDLDGDGLDDLVVGAPGEAAVHVILGATMAAATGPLAVDLTAAPADVTVTMPAGDGGGAAVAAGDLNDDGLDELVIGEPGYSPSGPRSGAGRVHVIAGRVFTPLPAAIDAAAAAELQLVGADGGDALGSALATGDFDGDGLGDVAAGTPGGDGAGEAYADAGEVVLWRGRALTAGAATVVLDVSAGEYELVLQGGADPGAGLGAAASLGDLDGDGRADLCAGAPLFDATAAADGPGTVACVLGATVAMGAAAARDQAAGAADVTIAVGGATAGAALGAALATGDVNNDGRADLLVGEPGSDAAFAGGGRAHLWLGRTIAAPLAADLAAVPAEATLLPEPGTAGLGAALVVADLDGDGFADLVIAAGPAGAGVAYVVRGGVNPTP